MSSNQRTPRDLRLMVSESSQDMKDMQESLAKLRALKEDDKTEAAMLRSRIDEQSRLIMILKQRADEEILRAQALERITKELSDFKDQADNVLKNEIRKYSILDSRFNCLASNHEEMIKIKDEYKRVNQELREENSKLKNDNSRLFSQAIQDKDQKIQELEKKLSILKEQKTAVETKFRQIQQERCDREADLTQQLNQVTKTSAAQIKELQSQHHEAEERLKAANHKLQAQQDRQDSMDQELSLKMAALMKEKNELLELTMQRGKLIQKEQAENKRLFQKIVDTEKLVKSMEEKFEREASSVRANLQVQKLKEELAESGVKYSTLVKEYSAYKKHSNDLLRQEKELNERLRHLVG